MKNNHFVELDQYLLEKFNISFKGEKAEHFYSLLHDAFTHSSMNVFRKAQNDYERLEWLGDGLIDAFVTLHLFKTYNRYDEGLLTKIRSAICSNANFFTIANKIGISNFILFGPQLLKPSIKMVADVYESLVAVLYLYDQHIAIDFVFKTLINLSNNIVEDVISNKNITIK